MYPEIKDHCYKLTNKFDSISEERKEILKKISDFIRSKQQGQQIVNLVYVCTHNSRRSHFGQVWAAVAASYYNIKNVHTFSGGTEATAFNLNAINALKSTGFEVTVKNDGSNPTYKVAFGKNESCDCFSKVYNHPVNPTSDFAAIMTCSDAEENCPFIPGVELRIATTYDDPKAFDGTPEQDQKYLERSNQIALETLFVFSRINPTSK